MVDLLEAPELKGFPERQKSLRVSFDLSYSMLSEQAKHIFCQSSFFPGGLYRNPPTLDLLLGDGWRNFIQEANNLGLYRFERDTQYYWMLNPVREYAENRLTASEKKDFYIKAAVHWKRFVLQCDFLLNPLPYPEAMERLSLPKDPEEKRKKLLELHQNSFTALKGEDEYKIKELKRNLEDNKKE
jgi:hypothetical protein